MKQPFGEKCVVFHRHSLFEIITFLYIPPSKNFPFVELGLRRIDYLKKGIRSYRWFFLLSRLLWKRYLKSLKSRRMFFHEIGQYGFFLNQSKILIIQKMLLSMILPSFHKKRSQFIQPWDITIFKVNNTKNVPHRTLNFVAINYHCYLLKFI